MGLIFITGMTGSGKTAVGEKLAALLGVPFTDLDSKIAKTTGRKIPEIFAEEGESAFREQEALVLRRIARAVDGVIALGAGALERDSNFELVHAYGALIYLRVPVDLLMKRLTDTESRPLLAKAGTPGELKNRLDVMLARRQQRYETAQTIIDIHEDMSIEETADKICQTLKRS